MPYPKAGAFGYMEEFRVKECRKEKEEEEKISVYLYR